MDGARDVPSGIVSAGPQGGDGGGDEHPGGLSGVRAAPGHCTEDAGLLRPSGLPEADYAPAPQPFDKLRRSDLRA